jgi:hypothetical protein
VSQAEDGISGLKDKIEGLDQISKKHRKKKKKKKRKPRKGTHRKCGIP